MEWSCFHTDTKKEAVDRAREIVENLGGGEVRQADRHGRFADSDTTKHGSESRAKDTKEERGELLSIGDPVARSNPYSENQILYIT